MLKNILKLDGVQKLNKGEQKSIHGGALTCDSHHDCPPGQGCCANAGRCMRDALVIAGC